MLGLLLKDILVLRRQLRVLAFMALLFLALSLFSGSAEIFALSLTIFTVLYPMTTLAYDDQANWHGYCRALPISCAKEALAKYLLALVFAGLAFLLSTIFLLLDGALRGDVLWSISHIPGLLVGLMGGLLVLAVLLPIAAKTGVEKARLWAFLLVACAAALVGFLPGEITAGGDGEALRWGMPIVVLLALFLSWRVTTRIYRKKD